MTVEETRKILFTINVAFPAYRPEAEPKETVKIWAAMLYDYPYLVVSAALKAFIKSDTKGFAPSIGQLIQLIERHSDDSDLTAEEAWTQVSMAISRGGYYAEEEFNKLPALIQRAIGSPRNIHELSLIDTKTVQSVEKSHFIQTYNRLLDAEKQRRKIPEDVQKVLGITAPEQKTIAAESTPEIEEKNSGVPMPEWAKERIDELYGGKE